MALLQSLPQKLHVRLAHDIDLAKLADETDQFTPGQLQDLFKSGASQAIIEKPQQVPLLLCYAHLLKCLQIKRAEIAARTPKASESPQRGSGAISPMKEYIRHSLYL